MQATLHQLKVFEAVASHRSFTKETRRNDDCPANSHS